MYIHAEKILTFSPARVCSPRKFVVFLKRQLPPSFHPFASKRKPLLPDGKRWKKGRRKEGIYVRGKGRGMLLIVAVGSLKRRRGRERVGTHRYTYPLPGDDVCVEWRSGIQVAGGSFDLSTGCPAGYVSFLSTFFCLFSPKEFRQRRGRFHREGAGRGSLPSWLQFSSRYSFCCLRENGRINK